MARTRYRIQGWRVNTDCDIHPEVEWLYTVWEPGVGFWKGSDGSLFMMPWREAYDRVYFATIYLDVESC